MNNIQANTRINSDFFHSKHSLLRASQRGIHNTHLDVVIRIGKVQYRQGLKFHYITSRQLSKCDPILRDKVRNLIVVTATDSNTVITCYKNVKAIGRIKRKSKRLL